MRGQLNQTGIFFIYFFYSCVPTISFAPTVNGLPLVKFQYFLQIPSVISCLHLTFSIRFWPIYIGTRPTLVPPHIPLSVFLAASHLRASWTFTSHSVRLNHSASFLASNLIGHHSLFCLLAVWPSDNFLWRSEKHFIFLSGGYQLTFCPKW